MKVIIIHVSGYIWILYILFTIKDITKVSNKELCLCNLRLLLEKAVIKTSQTKLHGQLGLKLLRLKK